MVFQPFNGWKVTGCQITFLPFGMICVHKRTYAFQSIMRARTNLAAASNMLTDVSISGGQDWAVRDDSGEVHPTRIIAAWGPADHIQPHAPEDKVRTRNF